MKYRQTTITSIIILILSFLLFVPFLGGVHLFDWDEINFAESAREMLVTGDYLTVRINYLPFWEKPPLFIWMQVVSMKIFGINEFAARFPNALCGIVTLLLLYHTGKKLYNHTFGIIWVLCFAGSILPFIYFKSGIIDPWFNLFIFCGIYTFILFIRNEKIKYIVLSAFFIGLAILTKGPVAFLIFFICALIYWILNRFKFHVNFKSALVFIFVLTFTGGFWFILQILNGNYSIIKDFIIYQVRLFQTEDAGHGGFLFYHFVVLLFGVFPASLFALKNLVLNNEEEGNKKEFHKWMQILFWVVLILFTIVNTKIIHYSSLCYFPLTYLAAVSLNKYVSEKINLPLSTTVSVTIVGSLYAILVIAVPFLMINKELFIHHIRDVFAQGNLHANVIWTGYEALTGLLLFTALIFFIVFSRRRQVLNALFSLSGITILFLFINLILFVPKIEKYSQNAAIEFFTDIRNEDAYFSTIGYKSYAHLFYGSAKKPDNKASGDKNWLLYGNIDKNVYFSSKVNKKNEILVNHPDLELLYEKNGFVFWLRKTDKNKTSYDKQQEDFHCSAGL